MNSENILVTANHELKSNEKVEKLTTLSKNINELSITGDVWIDNWKNSVTEIKNKIDDLAQSMMAEETPKTIQNGYKKITEWKSAVNHPLMSIISPDELENGVPSVLSEDETYYSPIRNTSKNNLYFSDNMSVPDNQIENNMSHIISPQDGRRKIKLPENSSTPLEAKNLNVKISSSLNSTEDGNKTPNSTLSNDSSVLKQTKGHSSITDWCDSPSQLRSIPNFKLPVEVTSNTFSEKVNQGASSPFVGEGPVYEATVNPCHASVSLHANDKSGISGIPRRRILLPPKKDESSLDSISVDSLVSDGEPPHHEELEEVDQDQLRSQESGRSSTTESAGSQPIPEYSAEEEYKNERSWLSVPLSGGGHALCDMKVIEPYKRALSHGGHDAHGAALIVLSACHLPDRARADYTYVMDSLFLYVIWTLERLVNDDYVLVYLHGSASRRRVPSYHWLHKCYNLIDRRLRKSLKQLYLVHPTFWLKTVVLLTKPFISAKFFRKLTYVTSLSELMEKVPLDSNSIPDAVKQYEARRAGD